MPRKVLRTTVEQKTVRRVHSLPFVGISVICGPSLAAPRQLPRARLRWALCDQEGKGGGVQVPAQTKSHVTFM